MVKSLSRNGHVDKEEFCAQLSEMQVGRDANFGAKRRTALGVSAVRFSGPLS
jgi:hypothetical protein